MKDKERRRRWIKGEEKQTKQSKVHGVGCVAVHWQCVWSHLKCTSLLAAASSPSIHPAPPSKIHFPLRSDLHTLCMSPRATNAYERGRQGEEDTIPQAPPPSLLPPGFYDPPKIIATSFFIYKAPHVVSLRSSLPRPIPLSLARL